MENDDLVRRLRQLRRTVDMLQSDLRHEYLNAKLLAETELQMEYGIATEPRCSTLTTLLDELRESTFTPRPEFYSDISRACERMKDAIEELVGRLK